MGFCRHEGAPIDDNPVERALKLPIQNRKNAYFFKTSHGADVGCLLMSMIKTASQAEMSPFALASTPTSCLREEPFVVRKMDLSFLDLLRGKHES